MAQYYKLNVTLDAEALESGVLSTQRLDVVVPTIGPAGPRGERGEQGPPGEVSGSIAWDNVSGKPATFPPSSHTHVAANITDFATAVAAVSPPVDWNSLTGKPATFAPSAHTHTASAIADFNTAAAAAAPVQSVAGRTGAVTLAVADVSGAVASTDSRLSDSRTPSSTLAHASSHHTGGTDALAAHQINGQTIFGAGSATYSTDQTLTASRARQFTISNTNAGGINITLPTGADGTLNGDTYVIIGGNTISGPITIRRINVLSPLIYETLATITSTGQQFRFRGGGGSTGGWVLVPVDTHTHTGSQVTVGTTANLPLKTGTNGVVEAGSFGTSAGSFCAGDDARLSDDRDPNLHAASHAAAMKAFFTGTVGGAPLTFSILADNVGTAGNSISFSFNGSTNIDSAVSAWNASNPSNTASVYGDGTQVPSNGQTITLSGGVNLGSDPLVPVFTKVTISDDDSDESVLSLTKLTQNIIEFATQELSINHTGGNDTPYISVSDGTDEALLGLRQGEMFLQGSNPDVRIERNGGNLANILMASAKLVDEQGFDQQGPYTATIDVQEQLTDDVTLTIPDQSGTLAVVTDIPTEVTDLSATGISADYIPVAQGDGTIVWEAQSGGGGGDTVSIQSTAADILSVSSGAISADDAGADRIVYWNNTSNKLTYGTPSDVGAAASSHTHSDATQSVAGFLSTADKTKLDGIASGAEVNVNADWNASSGDAQILNKPTLGTAAAAAATDFAAASHTHAASAITSGTLDVARLPVGTGSTQVAAGNHTHVVADVTGAAASGSITASGLTQATARLLGRTSSSTGAIEEITVGSGLSLSAGELSATGGGVTGAASSASDVLGVSGADITGVDANADRIIFFDDSAGKLTHLTLGSNALSIDGTTLKSQPLFPVEPISRGAAHISYIGSASSGNSSSAVNTSGGFVLFAPVYVRKSANYTTYSVGVSTAGSASSLGKMALYTIKAADATPDALVCESGTFAADSTGIKQPTMASTFVSEGWYYMAIGTNSTTNMNFNGDTMLLLRGAISGAPFNAVPVLLDYSQKLYANFWPNPWDGTGTTFRNAFHPITSLS
jgi:hypothetical protein